MSEVAQSLPARLRVAATTMANIRSARLGEVASTNVLDALSENSFRTIVEEAQAILQAVDDHDALITADLGNPNAVGIEDVERLAVALGAGTLALLVRDRLGRARALLWARAADPTLITGDAAQALWSGLARAIREQPASPKQPEEPAP
ncbi:hypothetical protein [Methylorubrum sp. POS3]|uniref:hypothetical protein n=1 Tax=Methylorubrum sp. POS3 TaxID=2998492 RepID=UPI003727663A